MELDMTNGRRWTEEEHEELQSLLGAHAMNAVSHLEARRVERHLGVCEDCAHEVRILRETAAELAWLTEPADADALVERATERLPKRPRRLATMFAAGVAAVAVVAAGFLGVALLRERSKNEQIQTVLAHADRRVGLRPQGGFDGAATLHIADGEAALVLDGLPEAGRERAYQLWAITGETPRSMTVFRGGSGVVLVSGETTADRFAVTIEPDGGSPVPTGDPVLSGA